MDPSRAPIDLLSIAAGQAGIKKPIELSINPLVFSPLLIGFFHPCIVLPSADIPQNDFQYIILHELTHYNRRDMFYKWLVQITLCLHWFNPLVHLMSREITKACEFSCDEVALTKMGQENAQDYGKTLLDAMAAVGKYKENLGAITLSENKQLLKERLSAIMNFKRKSKAVRLLTGVLTLCVVLGVAYVGVYSVAAASDQTTGNISGLEHMIWPRATAFIITFQQKQANDCLSALLNWDKSGQILPTTRFQTHVKMGNWKSNLALLVGM